MLRFTASLRGARVPMLIFGLACSSAGASELSGAASARANAWVGRDASALLLKLRVDGGRAKIVEDDGSMETRYTWSTSTPAWTERIHVSGGELIGIRMQPNNVQIPEYTPIVYDYKNHSIKHRCDVTYIADSEGVVRRWEHLGPDCDEDIVGP